MKLGGILDLPSSPATSAFVLYCRLTNQHLTFANQVSTRDKLVKDKKVEDYFSTSTSYDEELASIFNFSPETDPKKAYN